MADGQEKSPPVVADQQETPLEKHETEPLKGKMSIAPSVVSNKPSVKTHHVSVHQSEHRSEAIELTTLQIEKKRGVIIPSSHPIPTDVKSVHSSDSALDQDKKPPKGDGKEIDEKGIKQKHSKIEEKESEWSDDEACGLGRCESRASRVSRAVHKMFCCGVTYEAPSDEDVSSPRRHYGNDATVQVIEKKEVSRYKQGLQGDEHFQEIDLPSTSAASLTLVRKASVGPCRTFASVGGPSGITINIQRKSSRCINKPSGINVTISKKSLASVPPKLDEVTNEAQNTEKNIKGQQKLGNSSFLKCFRVWFGKK